MLPMKNQLKFSIRKTLLIMVCSFAVMIPSAAFAAVHFSLEPITALLPVLVLFFILYHFCLQVHISKSLSIFFSIMALMAILGMFAACYDAVRNPDLGVNAYTMDYALFHLAVSFAAVILLAFPLCKYGSAMIDRLNIPRVWYAMIPFSLLILSLGLFLRPVKYETLYVNRVRQVALFISCILLLLWMITHIIFYFIVTGILSAAESVEKKRLLEMEKSQFLAQQRYIQATAREGHDFRQSIRTLTELYKSGDYSSIGNYLLEYEQSMPKSEMQSYCKINALNALLNFYAQSAVQDGIDLRIDVQIPEKLSISDIELCRITGNLLENAAAGCRNTTPKWIRITFSTVNNSVLYIVATNSFDGRVHMRDGKYYSLSHRGEGIGLTSIASIAEKYGGYAEFHHEGNEFFSNVAIPLLHENDQEQISSDIRKAKET